MVSMISYFFLHGGTQIEISFRLQTFNVDLTALKTNNSKNARREYAMFHLNSKS